MPDATETTDIQTSPSAESGSLIVGRIRPPSAIWAALEGITNASPVRNGVLIIFSQNIKGRIGIFCNRYISGAVVEPSGDTGLEAVRELLSIKSGMFGFRLCMGDESRELAQSLGLDISELLDQRPAGTIGCAGEALGGLMLPGSQLLRTADVSGSLTDGESTESPEGAQSEEARDEASGEEDFSYFDWFAEQMGQKDSVPKFRQILLPALPKAVDPNNKPPELASTVTNDLELYEQLLLTEQQKVVRDIERSMDRTSRTKVATEEAVTDLKLLSEFIQSEQKRAQGWAGLDQIPTPRVGGGGGASAPAVRSGGSAKNTGEFSQQCDDLLATSLHKVPLPKEFIKRIAVVEEPEPEQYLPAMMKLEWLRDRRVIGLACAITLCGVMFGITSMQSNAEFETCLADAKRAMHDKHPDKAVFVLDQAISKDPTSNRAFFFRGLAYASMGEHEKALADFDSAIARGANRDRVLVARASSAMKAEKFEDALKDCNEILKQNPSNADALMLRATCHERQRSYDLVNADTTKALDLVKDPTVRAHLLLQRGVARVKLNQHASAEKDFSEAIQLKADASTYMQRGDAYRSLKRWTNAQADYDKVLDQQPRNYGAYVARGICYVALNNETDAMKDFGRALSIDKRGVEALIQRGSLHLRRSNYRLAANDLEDALRLSPRDSETQQKLAATYTHMRRAIPPSLLRATAMSGSSSITSDAQLPSAVKRIPTNPKEMVNVGYKYLTNGEVEYAMQMFAEAIKREPNNVDARRYMAHAMCDSGSSQAAVSQFEALVSLGSLTSRDALGYAKALTNTGNTERAVDILAHFLQKNAADMPVRVDLIRLYRSIGFGAKAEGVYREGLSLAKTGEQRQMLDGAYGASSGQPGRASSEKKPAPNRDLGG